MVREESACFRSVNQKQLPARTGGSIDYLLLNLPGESLFFIENAKLGKAEKEEDHHHHLNHRHYSATPPLGNRFDDKFSHGPWTIATICMLGVSRVYENFFRFRHDNFGKSREKSPFPRPRQPIWEIDFSSSHRPASSN